MSGAILRFAPSPNGRLHLGHAYSALLNDRIARQLDGRWLLRVEDIDPVRATSENIAGITEDLAWLGLAWPKPVRRQSEHMAEYEAVGTRLRSTGLVYPCFCTRGEIAAAVRVREASGRPWPRDPDDTPFYPGTCRTLDPAKSVRRMRGGEPHAWRIDTAAAVRRHGPVSWRRFEPGDGAMTEVAARPERWGDVVLVRKEVATSYHLSVVLDDAVQGVTHVVRGADVEAATDIHALLAACLDLPTPLYHHHRLVTDATGLKLSKSRGSHSLRAMREAGESADQVRRRLGFD